MQEGEVSFSKGVSSKRRRGALLCGVPTPPGSRVPRACCVSPHAEGPVHAECRVEAASTSVPTPGSCVCPPPPRAQELSWQEAPPAHLNAPSELLQRAFGLQSPMKASEPLPDAGPPQGASSTWH